MKALHSINPLCIPISTDSLRPWYTVTPIQKLIPIPIRHRNTTLKSLQCFLKQEQNITPSEANFHTRNEGKIPNHQTSRHEDYTDYDTEEGEEEQEKDDGRGVVIGPHGVGYKVPGAPFEFQYSYTETPKVKPLKLRENYLPFGPTTMERPWTGKAPLPPSKKKRREFDSFKPPPPNKKGVKSVQPPGPFRPGDKPKYVRSREEILGEPLTSDEVKELLDSCKRSHRQLHIGRDGLTHNMLENIHHHWKRRRVCKIRCLGVATVDMDNICEKLEEKTGGKIIHRHGGILYLFRGRNYNYKTRQVFPLMLWRPMTPVYPKLIQKTPAGLTENEATELRRKGRLVPPICALGRNGVYHNLVSDIRDAFEVCELVRIDCTKLKPSDFKRIAGKLKDTVPCVLLSFSDQHILLWRGKNWVSLHERIDLSTEEITYQVSDNESENMTAISNSDVITTTDDILDKNIKESVRTSATLTVTENNIFPTENVTAETISTMSKQHAALRNFDSSVQDEKRDCSFGSSEEENEVIKMATNNKQEELLVGRPSSSTPACSDEEFSQQNVQHFSNARGLEKQHAQDVVVVAETDHYQSGLARLLSIGLEANIPDHSSSGIVDNDSTSLSDAGYEGPKNRISADHMVDRKNENESVVSIEAKNEQEKTVNSELEALWDQAIDSGRLLLLNELDLDPDTILEKVAAFAKNAPPDPVFEPPPKPKFVPNMNKRRKELRKILCDGTKDVQETTESGKDSGGLPLDELARLLLQS